MPFASNHRSRVRQVEKKHRACFVFDPGTGTAHTVHLSTPKGMRMQMEEARILRHEEFRGGYRLLVLSAPGIAPRVQPGQFVHLRVPHLDSTVLRRPFSVYDTGPDALSIIYKDVGRGTAVLKAAAPGERVSLIGPLGHGFPPVGKDRLPVLVAGGYGMAALYLVARTAPAAGVAFFGGRAAQDILCQKEFEALGWTLRVTTEDGSLGIQGLVTDALDAWLRTELGRRIPEFYACGPNAMLRAVGNRAIAGGWVAWLSVDRNMGCGVGACLTCVQKIRHPAGHWTWERVCREGPVFESRVIVWEDEDRKLET
jgi:dihydroorotate dehydrogenase electron transfer subunit